MPKIMFTHTRLLLLGLLASLGSTGYAADSPFLSGSDSGLQVAVRVIADEPKESNPADDESRAVVRPKLPPADSEAEDRETAKKPEESADSTSVSAETSSVTSLLDWLRMLLEPAKDPEPAGQESTDESKEASVLPDETGDESREPAGPRGKETVSGKAGSETEAESGPRVSERETEDESREASTPAEESASEGEQPPGPSHASPASPPEEKFLDRLSILSEANENPKSAGQTPARESEEASAAPGEAGDKSDLPSGHADGKTDSNEPALAQETGKDAKPAGKPAADGAAKATMSSAETGDGARRPAGRVEKKAASDGAGTAQKTGKVPGTVGRGSAGEPKSASIPSGNAGRTPVPDMSGITENPGEAPRLAEQASSGEPEGDSVSPGEAGHEGGHPTVQTPGMPGLGQLGAIDATIGEPGLAGQASQGETREMILSRAQGVLNRVDQILLDARTRARQEREGQGDSGGVMLENDSLTGRTQGEGEGEFVEEGTERGGIAEGQVPGNVPTGQARPAHGYEEDDDIVARQVCDLAEREKDPEVRKQLEKKCKSLKKG